MHFCAHIERFSSVDYLSERKMFRTKFLEKITYILCQVHFHKIHAMAQAVSCWPLTAESRVRAWLDTCGICGGQSGTGAGFSPSSSVFPLPISFHH
jgi:hypothetical protein